MGFQPTWKEWWQYYQNFNDEGRVRVRDVLDRTISDTSGAVREEILEHAPQEIRNLYDESERPATFDTESIPRYAEHRTPEQLKQAQEAILAKLYNGQKPIIASVAKMRQSGGSESRWEMRRIASYLGRGILGGGGGQGRR